MAALLFSSQHAFIEKTQLLVQKAFQFLEGCEDESEVDFLVRKAAKIDDRKTRHAIEWNSDGGLEIFVIIEYLGCIRPSHLYKACEFLE